MNESILMEAVKNMQAQLALQQEALLLIQRKADKLLSREEKDHLSTCIKSFGHLLDRNMKLLGVSL